MSRPYGKRRGRSYTRKPSAPDRQRMAGRLNSPAPAPAPDLSFFGCLRAAFSLFMRAFK